MEMIERDKGYRREREGVVWGLERAMDLIVMAEEEQGQQAPPPQPSYHLGQHAPRGTPQKCQKPKKTRSSS